MKTCSKCRLEKYKSEFHKNKNCPDGLQRYCKDCRKKYHNKDKRKKYLEQYYPKNRHKIIEKSRMDYIKNKEEILKRNKKYRTKNKEKIKKHKREYYLKNKEKINKANVEYVKLRMKRDPIFKIRTLLRKRLACSIKKIKSDDSFSKRSRKLIGCTLDYLKKYIEERFSEGMTWENHGKWHLDHIKPICQFDLTKQKEIEKCFHYTNLQPLWAEDNLRKGKKNNKNNDIV